MIVGNPFARVFDTQHGPLLIYTENFNPDRAVLHQVMRLHSEVNTDREVEGTPEQVHTVFMNYDFLEAEETALAMTEKFEHDLPAYEADVPSLDGLERMYQTINECIELDEELNAAAHVRDSERMDVV